MQGFLARFRADDGGATAIEYGLIVALIALVLVGTLSALSGSLNSVFERIQTALTDN